MTARGLATICLAGGILLAACGGDGDTPASGRTETPSGAATPEAVAFSLRSDAFDDGQPIPSRFTCDGADISPDLTWSDVPDGVESFALIMNDPDAPAGIFTHWVIFDIPSSARTLPESIEPAEMPASGAHGRNSFAKIGYGGPCPPSGPAHEYEFQLYALTELTGLGPGASRDDLLEAMAGRVIGLAELSGTYGR